MSGSSQDATSGLAVATPVGRAARSSGSCEESAAAAADETPGLDLMSLHPTDSEIHLKMSLSGELKSALHSVILATCNNAGNGDKRKCGATAKSSALLIPSLCMDIEEELSIIHSTFAEVWKPLIPGHACLHDGKYGVTCFCAWQLEAYKVLDEFKGLLKFKKKILSLNDLLLQVEKLGWDAEKSSAGMAVMITNDVTRRVSEQLQDFQLTSDSDKCLEDFAESLQYRFTVAVARLTSKTGRFTDQADWRQWESFKASLRSVIWAASAQAAAFINAKAERGSSSSSD